MRQATMISGGGFAPSALVLIAAALLRIPARRVRALALGDEGALRDWIANESATRLAEARRDARVVAERLERMDARVVALGSSSYPAGLRDLRDPPPMLFVRGTLPGRACSSDGTAIVGARDADDDARAFARAFAAVAPGPIVSGLALGVDAAAHAGALDVGTPTLAYVGHGFGATYPPEHRELENRIVAAGGAILTESLPGETVRPHALVRRDRLQAAHAAAIVLVASARDGGAMHALEAARKLGRPRYALEPRDRPEYAGNAHALREGAASLPWTIAAARAAIATLRPSRIGDDDTP
ncbi:MAG: hypothetical protein NVSMB59_08630 [Vulcanimicrobiaceae bacterium]